MCKGPCLAHFFKIWHKNYAAVGNWRIVDKYREKTERIFL